MKTEVVDGMLIITTEDGLFTHFSDGYTETAVERGMSQAKITDEGYWKGPASFIITGFSYNFTALIYLDARSYTISQ